MKKKSLFLGILVIVIAVLVITVKNSPVETPITKKSYVSLGDSVAAGIGLEPRSDKSACNRTDRAYSHSVAEALDFDLTHIACSGATIPNGIVGSQEVDRRPETPQLRELFSKPKPALITITIGANDVGWTNYLRKCYIRTCGDAEDQQSVDTNFGVLQNNLDNLLTTIKQHYNNKPPTLIFTSYYQVFPTNNQRCLDLTGITDEEIAWARTQQARISEEVQKAVTASSYAHYSTVNFAGHELCTDTPWVQGITDKTPYHPTQAGQAAIASSVIKTYRSVTK